MEPLGSAQPRIQTKDWTALIKRIALNDQSALADLYDSTSRLLFGLILRILGDRGSAEEVLLDVYTQVWRQAASYDALRGAPLAWLLTIARTRAIDRRRSGFFDQQREEPLEAAQEEASRAISPEEATVSAERQELVRSALAALAPEQREVIELAYFSGLSHSEIALALGQPLGTVKTRTRLGMLKLAELLRPLREGAI